MFTMYARNRQADQKIDVLFMTIAQQFKLADNYFVISESKSILGGLFSSTKLKFKEIPAGITTEELMFVSDYFSLLAYQQIALAEGLDEPPDPPWVLYRSENDWGPSPAWSCHEFYQAEVRLACQRSAT